MSEINFDARGIPAPPPDGQKFLPMSLQDAVEVLLVEDSGDEAELAIHSLRRAKIGNSIVVARDGEEALDFVFARGRFSTRQIEQQPKVIMLDLKLPGVNGLQVLREVRADPRTASIPVIVMTSSEYDRDMIESYRLGVNSYVVKPIDFEKFHEAVVQIGLYWLILNRPPPGHDAGHRAGVS